MTNNNNKINSIILDKILMIQNYTRSISGLQAKDTILIQDLKFINKCEFQITLAKQEIIDLFQEK